VHPISHHATAVALVAIFATVGLRLAFRMLRLVLLLAVPGVLYLLHQH
jgi:hypothetical protein